MKKILKNKTFKNIGYLTVASIFSQMLSVVAAFYIPRTLGPAKYGTLNIVISYVAVFTVFAFTGINKVILRECSKNLSAVKSIFESFFSLKLFFSFVACLIAIGCLFFVDYEQTTKYYIIIFSISLILKPMFDNFSTVYQVYEELRYVAILNIVGSVLNVSLSIVAVRLGYGVLSLLIIRLVTSLIMLHSSYQLLRIRFFPIKLFSRISWEKKYLNQGFTFSMINILGVLSTKIDMVMLSILTTPENVGVYALAYNVAQRGLIVRGPISTSLFPYYAKKYAKSEVRISEVIRHTAIIALPSLIIVVGVLTCSKFLIGLIVGKQFLNSVGILNVLVLYLLFSYAIIPSGLALQTTNNEKKIAVVIFIKAIMNIFLNLLFYHLYGLIGIAYSTLVCEVLTFSSQFVLSYKIKKQKS